MVNPYQTPATSTNGGVPTARPIAWLATILQFAVLAGATAIGWLTTRSPHGVTLAAAAYCVYAIGSRKLIPRAHRRGIQLVRTQRFDQAIAAFQESYEFFNRHAWLDRYRAVTMLSPAAMSYREMALVNIAFAFMQNGQGDKAEKYYRRTLEEFPDNRLAMAALRSIESV